MKKNKKWLVLLIGIVLSSVLLVPLCIRTYMNNAENKQEFSAINKVRNYIIYEEGDTLDDGKSKSHLPYSIGITLNEMAEIYYPDYEKDYPKFDCLEYDELKHKSYLNYSSISDIVFKEDWLYVSYGNKNPNNTTFIFALDTKNNDIHCVFDSGDFYTDCYAQILRMATTIDTTNFETQLSALDFSNINISTNSYYTVCTGSITNTGKNTYEFVKIRGAFLDANNNVVDTDWTYAVGAEGLKPFETKPFRLTVDKNYSICDCNISIIEE